MRYPLTDMIGQLKQPGLVGKFIRDRRAALKLSQKALGQAFSPTVTTQFISNIERGVTPLPITHVATLCKALQIPERELMQVLEREYAQKVSNRLGDEFKPLEGELYGPPAPFSADFQQLWEAYQAADPGKRSEFDAQAARIFGFKKDSRAA